MTKMDEELEQHISADNARLDRIESKIDKLSETVISLARAEEKLISLEKDKKFLMERMVRNEEKIDVVENKVDETSVTVRVINRLFWLIMAAGTAGVVGMFFIR